MRTFTRVALVLCFAVFALAQNGRTVQAEVTYTGAGTVDASHKIYVVLWDTDEMDSGMPIALKPLESKKGTVTFADVPTSPVYLSLAYDPSGSWEANSPPPSGSSLGVYSSNPPKPDAIKVEPGKTAKISVTFDDSMKMP